VQADPIKPMVKAPRTKRLKPEYDSLPSILPQFCLQFQLAPLRSGRRGVQRAVRSLPPRGGAVQVDPIRPTLKEPGTKRLNLNCGELLSDVAFKFKLRR
jgi:hypothetical protein